MSQSTFSAEVLPDLLPLYYKRLFPMDQMYRWLSYGNETCFQYREFSFTLVDDVYIRYQSFKDQEGMEAAIQKYVPHKIDIGAIYNFRPKEHRNLPQFQPQEKELVFDIDMTDYDEVRTCCSGADVCQKCWKFMALASKILDVALREDFGYKHLLWVFSGRRGVHCWVCDEAARKLSPSGRAAVAEYLQLIVGGESQAKKVNLLGDKLHSSLKRAIDIVNKKFVNICLEEQDILGNSTETKKVLSLIPDENARGELDKQFESCSSSKDKWETLVRYIHSHHDKGQLKRRMFLAEEIMLQYTYPRLDINVTKGLNHLLKSPFCIHPKTGKVCVPFNPRAAEKFNPLNVPTINQLIDEIAQYDEKTKEICKDADAKKIKDYKKTSMYKAIFVFEEFLRNLEQSRKEKSSLGVKMEF